MSDYRLSRLAGMEQALGQDNGPNWEWRDGVVSHHFGTAQARQLNQRRLAGSSTPSPSPSPSASASSSSMSKSSMASAEERLSGSGPGQNNEQPFWAIPFMMSNYSQRGSDRRPRGIHYHYPIIDLSQSQDLESRSQKRVSTTSPDGETLKGTFCPDQDALRQVQGQNRVIADPGHNNTYRYIGSQNSCSNGMQIPSADRDLKLRCLSSLGLIPPATTLRGFTKGLRDQFLAGNK
ncbi:GD19735 [Drosophila simulans]|uniref:GD19735 n=1 Tax=Drosophila simulans TaxID=7240 RepID=B4QVI7_DROSI|nr:GD19735 [Drosophila simulans]